jgi:hypothetical protein
MATEDFADGNSKSTMLVYFSATCGLTSLMGADFLRPAQFTSILSSLIYCTRLLIMESVLPRFSHDYIGLLQRPQYGQLDILNDIRKNKMCDGTLSPLGEFISLAAYGQSLRQSEGPTIQFEWSDDGEEISWDGCFRVTMDGFRTLTHSAIQAATRQCERLMYDWVPPNRDLKTLRDRLSTATAGYSFVSDPVNGIASAYLELLMKACLSPVNRLTLVGENERSSWDKKAVCGYIDAHNDLLRMILLLCHLSSGQCARATELLTIRHSNTASQLRGICLYGGRLCLITRHHKTRISTNNEFYVVRFLPDIVTDIMYRYLVYIRPLTYMLLRVCFASHATTPLLFAPAGPKSAWTTAVLTRELQRLSQATPGISIGIGVQLYRQLSIAITERHLRGVSESFDRYSSHAAYGDVDAAYAWQSGHMQLQRSITYGLDGAFPNQLQPALLQLYLRVSKRWHEFLRLGDGCNGDAVVLGEINTTGQRAINPRRRLRSADSTEALGIASKRNRVADLTLTDCSGNYADSVNIGPSLSPSMATQEATNQMDPAHDGTSSQWPRSDQGLTAGPGLALDADYWVEAMADELLHYPAYRCLVCKTHGYAVSNLDSHLKTQHAHIGAKTRRIISARYAGLELQGLSKDDFPHSPLNPIPAIEGLPLHTGFACTQCGFLTRSWKCLKVHHNQVHGTKDIGHRLGLWSSVHIQTFFTTPRSAIYYFCVTASTGDGG